ncbi:MAG: hypothetical protein WC812_03045 [Candidatus Pacearchaeota archaeon]|jgi:hypothetical protein
MKKKYTRREAIKYGAKISAGALIYGAIGNVLGRGYRFFRDIYRDADEKVENLKEDVARKKRDMDEFYEENVKPEKDNLKEKFKKTKIGKKLYNTKEELEETPFGEKIHSKKDKLKENYKNWDEKILDENEEPDKISRRTFLGRLFHAYNEHPVGVATSAGIVYGGSKHAIKNLNKYRRNRREAIQREKIKNLEEELENFKEDYKNSSKDLENSVDSEYSNILIIVGLAGFLISLIIGSLKLTGNVISNSSFHFDSYLSIFLLVLSLILIMIGLKKKR